MNHTYGLGRVREPNLKHLEGPRLGDAHEGKDSFPRAAYVATTGKHVLVVHVFPKKTEKVPPREIVTALRYAKEVK